MASCRRRVHNVRAMAGFGSDLPKPPAKGKKNVRKIKRGKKAVEKAMKMLDEKKPRNKIDPEQAAKGRVDFAKVKDWGGGEPDDLETLKLESYSEDATAFGKPFYEQVTKHLELLQTKGALKIAQDNLPDFKKWSFTEHRYRQYLHDQLHIHQVFEDTAKELLSRSISGEGGGVAGLLEFGSEKGLNRAEAFQHDMTSLLKSEKSENEVNGCDGPTLQTVAYGKYLSQLCSSAASSEVTGDRNAAYCKLIAHAYSIRVFHLTTGTRIGARATQELNLLARQATNAFQRYPEDVQNPLLMFKSCVDKCGTRLSFEEKDIVFDELAASFKKTALMLTPLAHED